MNRPRLEPLSLRKSWSLFSGKGAIVFVLSTLLTPRLVQAFGLSKSGARGRAE